MVSQIKLLVMMFLEMCKGARNQITFKLIIVLFTSSSEALTSFIYSSRRGL